MSLLLYYIFFLPYSSLNYSCESLCVSYGILPGAFLDSHGAGDGEADKFLKN